MSRILLGVVIAAFAFHAYQRVREPAQVAAPESEPELRFVEQAAPLSVEREDNSAQFRCDGRTYCSQMTSCEEATFFIRHCPGTKMDGDNDGVPCEQQWCRN